jgi:hypothetical protein
MPLLSARTTNKTQKRTQKMPSRAAEAAANIQMPRLPEKRAEIEFNHSNFVFVWYVPLNLKIEMMKTDLPALLTAISSGYSRYGFICYKHTTEKKRNKLCRILE